MSGREKYTHFLTFLKVCIMLITFVLGELFRMFCIGIILFVIFSAGVKIGRDLMELVIK